MPGHGTRWGYHRLADRYARDIVRAACVGPGDLVVDIGAGTGALTSHLLAAGARVIAVELHPARADRLRQQFAHERVHVVRRDLALWRPPARPYVVVANPPFDAITMLLRRLTAAHSSMSRGHLVVPSYVAGRWARGAAQASRQYQVRTLRRLPDTAFMPAATQRTAVIAIERLRSA